MRQGQIKIYKKGGAAQFRLIPPRLNDKGYVDKEGAVLVEVAPGIGKGRNDLSWDWDRKIAFAISPADIMQICDADTVDIFHKSKGVPKKLQVQPGQNQGWFFSLAEGQGSDRNRVSLPLTDGEWRVLLKTFVQVFPFLVGWED